VASAAAASAFSLILCGVLAGSGAAQAIPDSMRPSVYAHRAMGTGAASLRARAAELVRTGHPRQITLRALRRFVPETDTWVPLPLPGRPTTTLPVPPRRQGYPPDSDPVLLTLEEPVGLFWAAWDEEGRPGATLLFAGPILCNDVMLGDPPPRQIATCVPFTDRAVARFVPDPARPGP